MDVIHRHYDRIGDEAYIYDSWLKNYRIPGCPQPIYYIGHRKVINSLLKNRDTEIIVAHLYGAPELIFGYAVVNKQKNILHWVYVKNNYRGHGIAHNLLDELDWNMPVFFTHRWSDTWIERRVQDDPKYVNLVYNPYLLQAEDTI